MPHQLVCRMASRNAKTRERRGHSRDSSSSSSAGVSLTVWRLEKSSFNISLQALRDSLSFSLGLGRRICGGVTSRRSLLTLLI